MNFDGEPCARVTTGRVVRGFHLPVPLCCLPRESLGTAGLRLEGCVPAVLSMVGKYEFCHVCEAFEPRHGGPRGVFAATVPPVSHAHAIRASNLGKTQLNVKRRPGTGGRRFVSCSSRIALGTG